MNRQLSLAGVAAGALGFAIALSAMYGAMRDLMVNMGGMCASGGPYAIAPGHDCSDTNTTALTIAPFIGIAMAMLLISASGSWSAGRAGGVGPVLYGATFAVLGWNFLDLSLHPPGGGSSSSAWMLCAVIFGVMGLGGLGFGLFSLAPYLLGRTDQAPRTATPMPALVRSRVVVTGLPFSTTALQPKPGRTTTAPGNPWLWVAALVVGAAVGAYLGVAVI